MLVEAERGIFRPVPGGWGKTGSTNVRLAAADRATLESALMMAWTNVAPKSLSAKSPSKKSRQDVALISHRIKLLAARPHIF